VLSGAKISSYRMGSPRYGTRGHQDKWDPTVKTRRLTPEQMERYLKGETLEQILGEEGDSVGKQKVIGFSKYQELEEQYEIALRELEKANLEIESLRADRQPDATYEQLLKERDNQISELKKDLSFWREHSQKIAETVNDEQEITNLRREVVDAHKLVTEVQDQLTHTENLFNEAMTHKENLQKEITILSNKLQRSKEVQSDSQRMYEDLKKSYWTLTQEITPLRQLAFLKLQKELS
jgi:uncharacterized coiled-coil DUF342 family protein